MRATPTSGADDEGDRIDEEGNRIGDAGRAGPGSEAHDGGTVDRGVDDAGV